MITSSFLEAVFIDYFNKFAIKLLSLKDVNNTEAIYNFYFQHLEELYSVYEMFNDEESRKAFNAAIKARLTGQVQDFRYAPEAQYFLEGFVPSEGDIAIDGGAFDGGTARDFTLQGAKVYSFEMSSENYQNCIPVAEKYGFTIENLGLSNKEGEEFYTQDGINGSGSRKGGNSGLIGRFIDLDTYVEKKNLPRVDYIKLDIEGAELDMLHGSTKTISRWKPKMAISAYHKLEDLWTLATYIKSIRSDYEFKFRHYAIDCRSLLNNRGRDIVQELNLSYTIPTVFEMVLYCK